MVFKNSYKQRIVGPPIAENLFLEIPINLKSKCFDSELAFMNQGAKAFPIKKKCLIAKIESNVFIEAFKSAINTLKYINLLIEI